MLEHAPQKNINEQTDMINEQSSTLLNFVEKVKSVPTAEDLLIRLDGIAETENNQTMLMQAKEKLHKYQRLENERNQNRGWETDQFILQKQVTNFNKQYDNYLTEINGLLTKIEQNKDLPEVTDNPVETGSYFVSESNTNVVENISEVNNEQQFNLGAAKANKKDNDMEIFVPKITSEELYERVRNNFEKKYEGIPVDLQERVKRTAKIMAEILTMDTSITVQASEYQSEGSSIATDLVEKIFDKTAKNKAEVSDVQKEVISIPAIPINGTNDNKVDKVIEKNMVTADSSKTEIPDGQEMLVTPEAVEVYKQTYKGGNDAWKRDYETYIQTYIPIKNDEGWMSKWFDARKEVKGGILDHLAENQMTIEELDNLSEGDIRELRNYLRQNSLSIVDFRALQELLNEIKQAGTVQISKEMTIQQVLEAGFVDRLVRLTVKQS